MHPSTDLLLDRGIDRVMVFIVNHGAELLSFGDAVIFATCQVGKPRSNDCINNLEQVGFYVFLICSGLVNKI